MNANTLTAAIGQIMSIITMIVGWSLILLVAAIVAQAFGAKIPLIPAIDPIRACYIAGAWYLIRK